MQTLTFFAVLIEDVDANTVAVVVNKVDVDGVGVVIVIAFCGVASICLQGDDIPQEPNHFWGQWILFAFIVGSSPLS